MPLAGRESLQCVRISPVVATGDVRPSAAGRPVGGGQFGAILVLGGGERGSECSLGGPVQVDLARVGADGCAEVCRDCYAREDRGVGGNAAVVIGYGVLVVAVVNGGAQLNIV